MSLCTKKDDVFVCCVWKRFEIIFKRLRKHNLADKKTDAFLWAEYHSPLFFQFFTSEKRFFHPVKRRFSDVMSYFGILKRLFDNLKWLFLWYDKESCLLKLCSSAFDFFQIKALHKYSPSQCNRISCKQESICTKLWRLLWFPYLWTQRRRKRSKL